MSPSDQGQDPANVSSMPDTLPGEAAVPVGPPSPSVWERSARVFVNPLRAWDGLDSRARWWFPLVISVLFQVALLLATYHRVLLPTMVEQWNLSVERGQMPPAQLDKIEDFFTNNPLAMLLIVGQQAVAVPLVVLLIALLAWFGVGFVLGTRFPYRLSLEVVSWSMLVRLPETVLTFAIGWMNETFKGIHFGLGALLPVEETPTKLHTALSVLMDAVGPFNIWYLFVAVVGCSVLSGAPRKNVAWVLTALYLALTVVIAFVAGVFGPGA
jgi:hypothetical protein